MNSRSSRRYLRRTCCTSRRISSYHMYVRAALSCLVTPRRVLRVPVPSCRGCHMPCPYSVRQQYSFYDLIISKARGKSGPLFHFDVHDDVRVKFDAFVEKDEVSVAIIVTFHRPLLLLCT